MASTHGLEIRAPEKFQDDRHLAPTTAPSRASALR
jgi:hypothetical protein